MSAHTPTVAHWHKHELDCPQCSQALGILGRCGEGRHLWSLAFDPKYRRKTPAKHGKCPSGERWPLSERADDAVWVPCSRPRGHDGVHRFIWEWTHDRPMPKTTEQSDALSAAEIAMYADPDGDMENADYPGI